MTVEKKMAGKCLRNVPPGTEISNCPDMKMDKDIFCMDYERYKCDVCGMTDKLDYDEMR